jgi:hypothetical protein
LAALNCPTKEESNKFHTDTEEIERRQKKEEEKKVRRRRPRRKERKSGLDGKRRRIGEEGT